mmetsp:Transcript_4383/g.5063  ORF Transcript_4383/g.5063 Transcript_4383/m.5063 type:complete len:259 (+) Transcript_4383:95-871(+)
MNFHSTSPLISLILIISFFVDSSSFSSLKCVRLESFSRCKTILLAKKSKDKGKKVSGGIGFGGGQKSDTSKISIDGKVRNVSGFQGSGTKPLRVAANTFDRIRQEYGKECCSDIYVRSPLNDKNIFWFVGKIARCLKEDDLEGSSIPTTEEAVISQKRLILEYAKRELRPQNLSGPFSDGLELWYAPADSEMDAVQNKISFTKVKGSISSLSDGFRVADVGYNPEIYVGDEVKKGGLRVARDDEGHPLKGTFQVNEIN